MTETITFIKVENVKPTAGGMYVWATPQICKLNELFQAMQDETGVEITDVRTEADKLGDIVRGLRFMRINEQAKKSASATAFDCFTFSSGCGYDIVSDLLGGTADGKRRQLALERGFDLEFIS